VHTAALRQSARRLSAATIARIDSAVAAEMRRERIPGLSVAVATDNQLRWERGYGFADLEACVPATPQTTYRLASVSKTITAVAVMQLVEEGRLDLDAPIQRYVPTFPAKTAPVTARQLLSHLSGIRHYRGDEELSVREYPSLTAALAIFENDSLVHAPGAFFTYSTYGYTLLGAALETVAGTPFVDYLRAHVFAPAGIATMRDDNVAAVIPYRARGYSRDSSGVVRNAAFLNASYKIPGGGLISTAGDVARLAARLQAGDLVKPTTFTQMATKAQTTDGAEVPYGYGLILGEIPDILPGAVWHGGVQQGFTTMVYMLPKERIALAVLANLEGIPGSLAPFTNDLARIIRDDGHRGSHAPVRP
jgi:CubicO group peptidase (beta-lactamase class C family)